MEIGSCDLHCLIYGITFSPTSAWSFLDSNFFTAFFGAIAGAYGAHYIAERSKLRQEILAEIRSTNVAITISVGITQSLLSLKKQIVESLMTNYKRTNDDLLSFKDAQDKGILPPGTVFRFSADFRSISPTSAPQAVLQEYIYDRLNWSGRPLVVTSTLNRSIDGLKNSILERNELVELFRPLVSTPDDLIPLYFGIPDKLGHTDTRYPDLLGAIYDQTDDGIFFSNLLYKDLREHGEKLRISFKHKFRAAAPTIHTAEFTDSETQRLFPNEEKYKDWLNNFSRQTPKASWLTAKISQIKNLLSLKLWRGDTHPPL